MKIAIIFVGIMRTDLEETIQNISSVKDNFKDHDVKTYFVTWTLPNEIAERIKQNVDFFHMEDEPSLEWVVENIPACLNDPKKDKPPHLGGSYASMYYMLKCRQIAMKCMEEDNNFTPDYTLLTRNDAYIKINDLDEWLNDDYNTTSHMHQRRIQNARYPIGHNQLSDQFSFAKNKIINDVFNISDDFISEIIPKSWNIESGVYHCVENTNIGVKKHSFNLNNFYLIDGPNGTRHIHRSN